MASPSDPACPECGAPIGSDGICAICLARDTALIDQGATHPSAAGIFDVPTAIGPYSIIKVLGEGGMGIVYLAEQAEPFRRHVALKVIKIGMNTREVVGRFEGERQALAMMNHSHIAQIYGAGVTDDGRPYFVMEHVPGVPITDYCEQHELSTRARLELFALVCGAVEHAHQKGVIHRDIKPQNILVTVQDGRPVPKVIDFGVAKATRQRLTEKTVFTHLGLLIGTPEYMSPEQAQLGGADITSSTDIYSLGVLLYELLVSALPFDATLLRRAGYAEIQRVIREEQPVPPSTRLSGLGNRAPEVAQRRQTDLSSLARELKRDLDWIALKALEKDPGMRYSSAAELAADIARYLQSDRVLARPSSFHSRFRSFRRLHPRLAASLSVLILVLLAAITWIWASASGVTLTIAQPVGGTVLGGGLIWGTHGTSCSTKRSAGEVVLLYILTNPGYVFDGFVGECQNTKPSTLASGEPNGLIVMNRSTTCVATFTQAGPVPAPVTTPQDFFYEMKAQDVIIARIQEDLARAGSTVKSEELLKALQDRRYQLERSYETAASSAYGRRVNERERLIFRVTRLLGECDIAAPPGYIGEVNRYIEQWQRTSRFEQAVKRAQENGYTQTIAAAFMARQLPPQYLYLAMLESGFTPTLSGPPTRWGIAKGMWQFIPETARRYGLNVGPYYQEARVDTADDRLNWEKATVAAARYINEIYATDAQASGLLTMASYNWGEQRIVDRLRRMPQNPRERNFWTLLAEHREAVPQQTYDYVFLILSAAVIGENPRLFGFQFDNPLALTSAR